ncbi:hypothetical protein A2U01_0117894, partial [Trifolium medium]|nr:hypothetical protein [Trifolium medium]
IEMEIAMMEMAICDEVRMVWFAICDGDGNSALVCDLRTVVV